MTTPTQLAAADARKARLRRIEQAAARHQAALASPVPVVASAACVLASLTPRGVPAKQRARRNKTVGAIVRRTNEVVAREFGISVAALLGRGRAALFVSARHVVVGILCEITRLSLPDIARRLNGRDHTTILYNKRRAAELFAEEAFRNRVDQLKAEILS
jgi:hypothetical protein